MTRARPTVAAIGYASLDHAMEVGPFLGAAGTTLVRRRLSDPWPAYGGVAHVARGLVAAGLVTEAVSWVGPDQPGAAYVAGLRDDGVDVRGIVTAGSRTPSCYLLYPENASTVCVYDPGDCHGGGLGEAQLEVLSSSDWVCVTVGPRHATEQALDQLPTPARLAWTVKADPEAFPVPLRCRLLQRATVVSFSADERAFLEEAERLEALRSRSDLLLVETRGAAGVAWWDGGVEATLEVPPTPSADTTGAGDRFLAGLVGALAHRPGDREAAVRAAIEATTAFLRRRGAAHG